MSFNTADYVARISTATPVQLVVISYEMLLHHLNTATEAFDTDKPVYEKSITKAGGIVRNLMDSLNINMKDTTISDNLMSIYVYINKLIIQASFGKSTSGLHEAIKIVSTLLEGWSTIEKKESGTSAIMENTQQLYAGLTYRKGKLDEYIHEDIGRGYKA